MGSLLGKQSTYPKRREGGSAKESAKAEATSDKGRKLNEVYETKRTTNQQNEQGKTSGEKQTQKCETEEPGKTQL